MEKFYQVKSLRNFSCMGKRMEKDEVGTLSESVVKAVGSDVQILGSVGDEKKESEPMEEPFVAKQSKKAHKKG